MTAATSAGSWESPDCVLVEVRSVYLELTGNVCDRDYSEIKPGEARWAVSGNLPAGEARSVTWWDKNGAGFSSERLQQVAARSGHDRQNERQCNALVWILRGPDPAPVVLDD